MRVTLVQMNSIADKAANLAAATDLIERAIAEERPDWLLLPECFDYLGGTGVSKREAAETFPDGAAYRTLQGLARKHRVFIHGGSMLERIPGEERLGNTTVAFDRDGREVVRYRKIHLFDITTPDGAEYRESASFKPGDAVAVYDCEGVTVGCAICYDLRFPALFQALTERGADLIALPAAFTLQTGKDHWEVLCRARAIETETYFCAAAQTGTFMQGNEPRSTYGHSLVADPWGHVVARASDGVGFASARIDRRRVEKVRRMIPVAQHRVAMPPLPARRRLSGLLDLDRLLGPQAERSPEMQSLWDRLVAEDGGLPNWLDPPVEEARAPHNGMAARWNMELPPVRTVWRLEVAAEVPLDAELIEPLAAGPGVILFLHGGGWAFGKLETYARFARLLATETKSRVLALHCRQSPEHPYPAPVRDAAAGWRWVVNRASSDPDFAGPLGIAGDSAGANLAMAVMLDAVRQGARRPDAALLFYGAFDRNVDSRSYRRFAQGFGLTQKAMTRFWDWYAPTILARDPLVAAVAASDEDLRALPPLFLNAAGLDPLLCDTYALAERLGRAGAAHEVVVHDGVHHGFMQITLYLAEARDALVRAARFWSARAEAPLTRR